MKWIKRLFFGACIGGMLVYIGVYLQESNADKIEAYRKSVIIRYEYKPYQGSDIDILDKPIDNNGHLSIGYNMYDEVVFKGVEEHDFKNLVCRKCGFKNE